MSAPSPTLSRSHALSLFVSLWLPVLFWAAFIFYLSSIPHLRFLTNDLWDFIVRKIGHLGVFGILARLLARAFAGSRYWSWKKIFAWSLILTILYACTDEYHQTYVPGRHASATDVSIDTLGAWAALGFTP
jgi:VanZ family protein